MNLVMELERLKQELNYSIKQLRINGEAYAAAERDYKIALRRKSLILKDDGMAVTLIDKVVYGERDVAEKRFKRDVAEAVYMANQECIQSTKLQMRLVENQIAREWGQAGQGGF